MRYGQAEKYEIIRMVEESQLPAKQTLRELEEANQLKTATPRGVRVTSWMAQMYLLSSEHICPNYFDNVQLFLLIPIGLIIIGLYAIRVINRYGFVHPMQSWEFYKNMDFSMFGKFFAFLFVFFLELLFQSLCSFKFHLT